MTPSPRLLCLIALPLALAACQGETKKAAGTGTAEGEILPASASDAMLPLDTVRSQPPLAPIEVATGKPGKPKSGGEDKGDEADGEAREAAAAPAPAPTVPAAAAE